MSQSLEDKVIAYRMLAKQIKELEDQKKALNSEIMNMLAQDVKTFYIADFRVSRWKRLLIKTSLEEARILKATKHEEIVDKEMIKQLFELGHVIPGVTTLESLIVSDNRSSANS
ncbi:MAG: hypothetical protein V4494_01715 [Chlamydiota bacterium]